MKSKQQAGRDRDEAAPGGRLDVADRADDARRLGFLSHLRSIQSLR